MKNADRVALWRCCKEYRWCCSAIAEQNGKALDATAVMNMVGSLGISGEASSRVQAMLEQRTTLFDEMSAIGGDGAVVACNTTILQGYKFFFFLALPSCRDTPQ